MTLYLMYTVLLVVMPSMINTLLHAGPLTRLFLHGTANQVLQACFILGRIQTQG